jgi:hypothetical protein
VSGHWQVSTAPVAVENSEPAGVQQCNFGGTRVVYLPHAGCPVTNSSTRVQQYIVSPARRSTAVNLDLDLLEATTTAVYRYTAVISSTAADTPTKFSTPY